MTRFRKLRKLPAALAFASLPLSLAAARFDDLSATPAESRTEAHSIIPVAAQVAPQEQPPAAVQETPTPTAPQEQPLETGVDLGTFRLQRLEEKLSSEGHPTTLAQAVGIEQTKALPASDLAKAVEESGSATSLNTQRRSQVSFDPRVRGYHIGQLYTFANGAYWFPARQDLDTVLSKIDPGIIDTLVVVPGPYRARYGPGFSFIDVETLDTPRYQNGYETHGRTNLNYQTNGEQWYGRQTIWGGSTDWGYRFGYGHRTGSDYESGDDLLIPSSYNSRDIDSAIGFDLSLDSRIEFGYLRLDQTDTEYPGQVFDVDYLVTDGYTLRYIRENQCYYDQLTFDAWYNRTRFEGNAQNSGKRRQIPELNSPNRVGGVLGFVGFTDVDEMSTGFRLATTWGQPEFPQLTIGADLRFLEMELNEFDSFDPPGPDPGADANFPIPRSHHSNPGVFVEHVLPVHECFVIKSGGRVDWVSTDTVGRTIDRTSDELHDFLNATNFDQHFVPWAAYMTMEYNWSEHFTIAGGFGHAERPPTLTELYAVDPFLAVLQQGFTQVRGNPELDQERLWQIDLGAKIDCGRYRGGLTGFYAWIDDYITYQAHQVVSGVNNGLQVKYVNTDLATLSGFEGYSEFDYNDWLTPFARISYVEGRDHSRGSQFVDVDGDGFVGDDIVTTGSDEEPLPSISPFETRVGLRIHEPCKRPRWGLEFAVRIVENQDRIATSLLEQPTPGFTVYDLRGYWQAAEDFLVVAGVENFTDKNYQEHLDLRTGRGVFQPGINFYFGMEWTF